MPDFSGRTDRELLDTLAGIQADPASYVPTAADEVRRILEQRYPRQPLSSITAAVEASEQELERRRDWIEARTDELLNRQLQPSSPPPDAEANGLAVHAAIRSVGFAVFRECLLVLAIPTLFVLGFIEALDPSSLWLAPFHVMLRFPFLKYIGALPWAMAKVIEFTYAFVPAGYALLAIVGFAFLLVAAALAYLATHIRQLRWLRRLLVAPAALLPSRR